MNKVYIVVQVTYDYYRFQNNLAVFTTEEACHSWIKWYKENNPHENYVTYLYDSDSEHEKLHNETGICHYWLQSFEVNE